MVIGLFLLCSGALITFVIETVALKGFQYLLPTYLGDYKRNAQDAGFVNHYFLVQSCVILLMMPISAI